jgi:MoaA/NifB/PqqE/SkfB family radical SAM enzyme
MNIQREINTDSLLQNATAMAKYLAMKDDFSKRIEFDRFVPRIFQVETVLGCNLSCLECAVGADLITRRKGCMDFETFKVIAERIRPHCNYLLLHNWGEPLLNKDIFKIISYASSFAKTNISTNGMLITEDVAEKLICSGVSDLLVSIDAVSQEVYRRYRVGGDIVKALHALELLQRSNMRHGGKVAIMPQFILFSHNQHEMEQFGQLCTSLGLNPSFKAPYLRAGSSLKNSDKSEYQRQCYLKPEEQRAAMAECIDPRQIFTILVDGSAVICCHDYNGETCFGNVIEQSVLDIWNSAACRQFRWDIVTGNAPTFCVNKCMTYKKSANSNETAS